MCREPTRTAPEGDLVRGARGVDPPFLSSHILHFEHNQAHTATDAVRRRLGGLCFLGYHRENPQQPIGTGGDGMSEQVGTGARGLLVDGWGTGGGGGVLRQGEGPVGNLPPPLSLLSRARLVVE